MKLSLLACSAMLAIGAVPAAATTTASAALAAPAPRIAAAGAHPAVPAPLPHRHGGTETGGTVTGATVTGGTRLWLARYGHPPNSVGYAQSVG